MAASSNLKVDFYSKDPSEVQDYLGKIYADNAFQIRGKRKYVKTRIWGGDVADTSLYHVSYGSPFRFLSESARDSFLIISCTGGSAVYSRDDLSARCVPGVTVPISATRNSLCVGGSNLAHISTHISAIKVHEVCEQWLGRPLDMPLLLDLVPFSPELTARWADVVTAIDAFAAMPIPPAIASTRLQEYAITLLLEMHPHNYSRFFDRREYSTERMVEKAKRYIDENAHLPITIANVAAHVGCSVIALHQAFLVHESVTPRAYLCQAGLQYAHHLLASGEDLRDLADVAHRSGFICVSRFVDAYTARYGEHPLAMLRRNQGSHALEPGVRTNVRGPVFDAETKEKLAEYIECQLGGPINLASLIDLSGMRPHHFLAAFRCAFGTSPMQYVITERLRVARWLLRHTQDSISSIAAETGFSSQSHLTTALKQHDGLTPKQARLTSSLQT